MGTQPSHSRVLASCPARFVQLENLMSLTAGIDGEFGRQPYDAFLGPTITGNFTSWRGWIQDLQDL